MRARTQRLLFLAVGLVCAAAALPAYAQTARGGPLTGTWSGYIVGQPGSGVKRQHIVLVVGTKERGGSWKVSASSHRGGKYDASGALRRRR